MFVQLIMVILMWLRHRFSPVMHLFLFYPKIQPRLVLRHYHFHQIPKQCLETRKNRHHFSVEERVFVNIQIHYGKWNRFHQHTIKFALHIWCLINPPPTMITPELSAFTAIVLSRFKSERMSTTSPGFRCEWKYIISPRLPSVKAGLNTGILFFAAQ